MSDEGRTAIIYFRNEAELTLFVKIIILIMLILFVFSWTEVSLIFFVCKHRVPVVRSQVSPSLNILPVHTSIIFLSSNLIAISYLLKKPTQTQYLIFLMHLNLKQTSKSDFLKQRWERKGANLTLLCWQNQNGSRKNPFLILKLKIIKS